MTLTNLLVAINVAAFIWLSATGGLATDRALYDHGALYGPAVLHGQWWRIVTGAFLHGGIAHVGLNMLALYQVGNLVETILGRARFAAIYAISLVGSGLAVVVVSPDELTVGASGAIFGLFGALVAIGLRAGARGRGLVGQVVPIIAINLVFTFAIPNISASAHLGGLITGFVAGYALLLASPRRECYAAVPVAAGGPEPEPEPELESEAPRPAGGPVETIVEPPDAGPHEEAGAPVLRDPRE